MPTQILRLNKAGQAMEWLSPESAACLYARQQVVWTYGENTICLRGGISRQTGVRSTIILASVIATEGKVSSFDSGVPMLSNSALFRRDGYLCLYCGNSFKPSLLTRDHVIPKGKGGPNTWENCVSACKSCNNYKGCRTPEEASMKLLAIPFKPNKFEYLAFANRNILADQMDFLMKGFSKNMRL
jgi:hypothetical protein